MRGWEGLDSRSLLGGCRLGARTLRGHCSRETAMGMGMRE